MKFDLQKKSYFFLVRGQEIPFPQTNSGLRCFHCTSHDSDPCTNCNSPNQTWGLILSIGQSKMFDLSGIAQQFTSAKWLYFIDTLTKLKRQYFVLSIERLNRILCFNYPIEEVKEFQTSLGTNQLFWLDDHLIWFYNFEGRTHTPNLQLDKHASFDIQMDSCQLWNFIPALWKFKPKINSTGHKAKLSSKYSGKFDDGYIISWQDK